MERLQRVIEIKKGAQVIWIPEIFPEEEISFRVYLGNPKGKPQLGTNGS